MKLNGEQILENYNKFLSYIDSYIEGDRKEKLRKLYDEHAERISIMPASPATHHHNAFPGGYVDHVMRVIDIALDLHKLWTKWQADTSNYTEEELVFSAMNHDLGKIGTKEHEMYMPNDSEWHRKNLGQLYRMNGQAPFMPIQDRSLFLLQQYGIDVTINEWIAIKSHDGLYDESNKPYFISRNADSKLKTHLPILLHHADCMAARIEYEHWLNNSASEINNKAALKGQSPLVDKKNAQNLKDIFNKF